MVDALFTLFATPIGRCSIAWNERGIALLQLPESSEAVARARILRRFPSARPAAPPAEVKRVIDAIGSLLRGQPAALEAVELDMHGVPPFHQRVYEAARRILPGATLSYGAVAVRAGAPGAARAVGQALRKNPFAIVVPCHRVLAAGGKIGGFTANGGLDTKRRLLELERPELALVETAVHAGSARGARARQARSS
jgi:methylated-DNA-[protein]-cysteine S-methyltransferase